MKQITRVVVRLKPSRWMAGFIVLAALTTAIVVVVLAGTLQGLAFALALPALAGIGGWAWYAWRTHVVRVGALQSFALASDGIIEWTPVGAVDGETGELTPDSAVGVFRVVMNWRNTVDRRRHSLTLFPDNLHPDEWRALRVMIRNQGSGIRKQRTEDRGQNNSGA